MHRGRICAPYDAPSYRLINMPTLTCLGIPHLGICQLALVWVFNPMWMGKAFLGTCVRFLFIDASLMFVG